MGKAARLCAVFTVAACAVAATGCRGAPKPRLLLLITADTLRTDELGAYGSPLGLTPRLDELAESGVVFASAYAPASFTLPSVAAILTGRYPEELGIRSNESALPGGIENLASELSGQGWLTRAVVGNFVLRRASGVAQGFQHFDDSFPRREPGVRAMPERTAEETTRAAVALLADCVEGAACFLWVHYQDPHGPYSPPTVWRERAMAGEAELPDSQRKLPLGRDHWGRGSIPAYQALDGRLDVGFYRAGYRGEIAYMDHQIGVLLDAVAELGLADATVVAFAADHGESLGEDEVWFSHGTGLGDEQVRVPLMIRAPGLDPSRREQPVSLVDLRPTLVALATGAPGIEPGSGRDLLAEQPTPSGGAYITNLGVGGTNRFALVDGDFKFVATERDGVFDGRLQRRGREDVDLAAAAPHVASRLRSRLVQLRRRVATGAPETRQELDGSDRAELRALGYLAAPEEPAPE